MGDCKRRKEICRKRTWNAKTAIKSKIPSAKYIFMGEVNAGLYPIKSYAARKTKMYTAKITLCNFGEKSIIPNAKNPEITMRIARKVLSEKLSIINPPR